MLDVRRLAALYRGEPAIFRKFLHSDRMQRIWGEAQPDQRLGAFRTQHQIFALTNGRRSVDTVIEVPVPVGDVLLPACEIAAALQAVFLARQNIEAVYRMKGEIDRAATAQRLETLRSVEAAHRNERWQLVQAVKVVPFRFAARIGKAAFHRIDHRITFDRKRGACGLVYR